MGKPKHKWNPERRRMRFSKEFKLEAVRLLALGQKPQNWGQNKVFSYNPH